MANLSNINNVLRTGSLGVGINRDPLGAFEISSATKPGIKMFNTASSGKTYEAYSDTNGNYIIYDQDADSNRLTISSAGNATFAANVNLHNANSPTLSIKDTTNNANLLIYSQNSDSHIGTYSNHSLKIDTNSTLALTIDTNQNATFAGDVKIAEASNKGQLFFGTANTDYEIKGGGNYGYLSLNAPILRFDTGGTERMRISSVGDILCTSDGGTDAFRVFNASTGAGDIYLRVEKAYSSAAVARSAGIILGSNAGNLGSTWTIETNSSNGYFGSGNLDFIHNSGGTPSTRMRITSGGDVEIQGGDIFLNSGTNYNDKGVVYLSNERTAIISDIVNATANGDTSLDFQTRKGGTRASALFIDQFRNSVFSFSVGIGMTPAADAKLEIADGTFRIRGNQSHSIQLANSSGNTRAALGQAGNEGDLSLYRSSNTKHVYLSSYYNSYINPSNGNLGIGTTSPSEKLHVSGGNVRIDSVSNANHLIIQNNATATSGVFEERIKFLGWNDNENAAIIGIGNAYFGSPVNALAFSVSAVEAMRIKHGGNVNFGKQPGDGNGPHLIVNSFSYTTLMQGTSTANIFVIRNGTGLSANVGMILFESNAGGASGQITTNSSTNTTSYNTSGSDERLKKNITDWNENVLDKFKDIQPKKFHFKTQNDDSDKIKGYIAQNEVDKFPEAYPLVEDKESGEKRYLFNPSGMNVYLMKAIQELKADNDSLKARIETLENK